MKLIVGLVCLFAIDVFGALTPQKYCESLASTSCELLNLELTGPSVSITTAPSTEKYHPLINIKYCRNRIFKTVQYTLQNMGLGGQGAYPRSNSGTNSDRRIAGFSDIDGVFTKDVPLDNNLCSAKVTLSGSDRDILP